MGTRYLTDTNVVIDYLDNKLSTSAMHFMNGVIDEKPNLSVITKIELLRFNSSKHAHKVLTDFISSSKVLDLTDGVVNATIEVCKEHRIKLPDGIIAATALCFGFTLLSRNTADFKNITDLKMLNPWEL